MWFIFRCFAQFSADIPSVFSWFSQFTVALLSFQLIHSVFSCFSQFPAALLSFQLIHSVFSFYSVFGWFTQFSADLKTSQFLTEILSYGRSWRVFADTLVTPSYSALLSQIVCGELTAWMNPHSEIDPKQFKITTTSATLSLSFHEIFMCWNSNYFLPRNVNDTCSF